MKFNKDSKYVRWGLTAFAVIAGGIAFYYFIFHSMNIKSGVSRILNILKPVLFGLATAYLLTPVLNFVENKLLIRLFGKCKIKKSRRGRILIRGIGILITAFLFVALIYMLVSMLISQIIPSVQGIIDNFDSYSTNVTSWINQTLEDNPEIGNYVTKTVDQIEKQLNDRINDIIPSTASLIKTVSLSVINVLDVLWDFIIGFIISIYVLANKERFAAQAKKITYALFEQDTANIVIRNFRFTHRTFIGFLSGKVLDSIIIGILCFAGTTIMGTPYAMLISVIIGCTNIIPFFGPFLGAIPSAVLIFVVDPMHPLNCVYFALFALALQQFDGNILGPKILGNSTGLTGFWVIFAITFFGGLLGVFGMIVGVPIFAIIYAAIRAFINARLEKKRLPKETNLYETVDYIDDKGMHSMVAEPNAVRAAETKKEKGESEDK
ncbi:AI-2E family transporter [Acetatifactor aquisgranensis]|uniref:AI-2E family transporter n=1 Tax=Acetatifactor aquisgranensis TaxID=2941233 RepID=UPI00203B384B|nr:AI-2E family transporter [Acetatifactor aquisgranensis]